MPFENITRDSRIFWLTEAAAVLLADNLNQRGASAITREERRAAFERLQVPPAAVLTDATVIRIGQLVGRLARGRRHAAPRRRDPARAREEHRRWRSRASRPTSPKAGRCRSCSRSSTASPPTSRRAGAASADRSVRPESAGAGLRELHQGAARRNARYRHQLSERRAASRPIVRPAEACAVGGLHRLGRTRPGARRCSRVCRHRPVSAAARRFLAGLSQLSLNRLDDAFGTFTTLSKGVRPPPIYNNLGVVQLRRGGSPQSGQATYYFNRAAETSIQDADYFFNLGYAYWLERDSPAAIHWLREAVRRDPDRWRRALRPGGGARPGRIRVGGQSRAGTGPAPLVEIRRARQASGERPGASRPRAREGRRRTAARARSRGDAGCQRPAQSAGACQIPSRSRPADVRGGARSRRAAGAQSSAFPVAL